jgi:hypothetical protein
MQRMFLVLLLAGCSSGVPESLKPPANESLKRVFTAKGCRSTSAATRNGSSRPRPICSTRTAVRRPALRRPAPGSLGRRHAGYGVKDEHYATVAAALLWTLEQGLGARFTPDVREAWSAAYGLLASTMQSAARQQAKAA